MITTDPDHFSGAIPSVVPNRTPDIDQTEVGRRRAEEAAGMFRPKARPSRRAALILGSSVLASLAGCFKWMQPVSPITAEQSLLVGSMPQTCRNHVYSFFILGADPTDCADVGSLRKHLQKMGFIKAYLGDWFYKDHFAKEIHKVRQEDKLARFALIGYGLGASKARSLAEKVQADGVTIDLLVYLGESGDPPPPNVMKLVAIQGTSHIRETIPVEGAENIVYAKVNQHGSVKHPKTLDVLVRELTWVASRIPVIDREPGPNPFPEPVPRPLGPVPTGPRDEWDFLKPRPLTTPGQQPEMLPQPKPVEPPQKPDPTTTTRAG
jgi:hypothetical protein